MQLIGPAWGEDRLLAIGLGMEQIGWVGFQKPPR
jgi:Asp-tRNA(Asn)/Glu-tRNA(Gln) amidotransferase A subunit family amidase